MSEFFSSPPDYALIQSTQTNNFSVAKSYHMCIQYLYFVATIFPICNDKNIFLVQISCFPVERELKNCVEKEVKIQTRG